MTLIGIILILIGIVGIGLEWWYMTRTAMMSFTAGL